MHGEAIDGTYAAEACNGSSGRYYDLDVDIMDGEVATIHFPNGGHLDLSGAELDENGYATGEAYTYSEGYTGDSWDVSVYDLEFEEAEDW